MNELEFYRDFIRSEEERLKKQRPEYMEDIAAEMARRGFLGGAQHMTAVGMQLGKEVDYLSQLRAREADIKVTLLKERLAGEEAKKQAKRQRRYELLMGITQLLTQPYKYKPTGEAKLGYEGVRDWLARLSKKVGEKTKLGYEEIKDWLLKNKPYERRKFLGNIETQRFNNIMNFLRPRGTTPSLLSTDWRESLKPNF